MTDAKETQETHEFQAEVGKLLELMVNSLYREKEIFLRELISNASDACDKLRYAAITESGLLEDDPELKVTIALDKTARTITVADNGIGMNRAELVDNLGTIARSGTEAFIEQLTGDAAEDAALIGQFGVGFYATFMVAKRVEVFARKAGETEGWRWESDGRGAFSVAPDETASRGARIVLHLRKGDDEFLEPARIRTVVKTYSDHIALPIALVGEDGGPETLNEASALWTRPKAEITDAQYQEFYRHVAHLPGEPWHTIHLRAEGRIEYAALLFIPDMPPFDLFDPARQHRVKLYVKRIYITDECEGLVPPYLRFLRGVVDSSDLPLNISRETLQHNPVVAKIRGGLVKRVIAELKKKADKAPADYAAFWRNFGAVLKEGLYEDESQRGELLEIVRFQSTTSGEDWVSLADYVARAAAGQNAIYYISGGDPAALRKSPQIEGFKARGLEVLLMSEPVDQFWLPAVGSYRDQPFRSVTQGSADLEEFAKPAAPDGEDKDKDKPVPLGEVDKLIALVKLTLGDTVKDVRVSERLTDSPVCLVADEGDLDIHLAQLLRQHRQHTPEQKRILEINPSHALIRVLVAMVGKAGASDALEDAAHLLLDQARILEGEPLPEPGMFSKRLADLLTRSLET